MNKQDAVKQEIKDVRRNYTRTPNILFEGYPDLRPQEKWLFINLIYLCGARGTRHLSLRYIHDRTGISLGALSGSKDPAKNDGMIRRLHNAGLIHAEIKKKKTREGKESDQAQYHITIVDIWQLNESFFHERSENEHFEDETHMSVQNPNASVQNPNAFTEECSESERKCSENERERSENDTNIRLDSKITKQESNDVDANAINNAPAHTSLSEEKTEQVTPPTPSTESEQTPEPQVEKKPARKRAPRKPRAKGFEVPDELAERVTKVYESLNGWAVKKSGIDQVWFTPDDDGNEAICLQLTSGRPLTPKILEQVCNALWDEPKNTRNGYWAREHMTVKAIINAYKAKSLMLSVNETKANTPAITQPYSVAGYTYKPEEAKTPDLPFAGPFRLRNKKRGA